LVDSDMHVDGSLCRTLLSFDKPMIGCAYSTKHPNAGKRYWHAYLADGAAVERGAARCEGVAFGATLIRRDVLETMIERGAAKPQRWLDEQFYNFFGDRPADAAEGVHTAEDVSFCRRWRIDCGGEIWAYLDARIGHIGDYAYGADQSYLDWLKEKGAFTPQGV
jgi:hypothetical protein